MFLSGQLEFPRFDSALLRDNRLGDRSERELLVYLPPGYADSDARYPLLMVLPAYGASHRSLANVRAFELNLIERFERAIVEGRVPPALLVAPDCTTKFGGSQYLDSSVQGPYQRYLVEEIVPYVDANYRTIPERAARAVAGHSSGGFGALRLAIDRPEVFARYGSHAADSAFEASIRPMFTSVAITLNRAGGLTAFVERFEARGLSGPGDFEAVMTIATAIAYAPEPEAPYPHIALPFELETARPIDARWVRWTRHDPCVLLRADPQAMRDAERVFVDAGDRDEHGLQFGAREIARELENRGVNVRYEPFEGGHRGATPRFEHSIPWLMEGLGREAL